MATTKHTTDHEPDHKLAILSTGASVPTFEHALQIFAYHIGEIMREPKRVRVHFYGNVSAEYVFTEGAALADPLAAEPGNTASVPNSFGGYSVIGNRCAARNDYTEKCRDVLSAIADGRYKGE